ncbi:MAG: pyridoxamine 5'-phosphate oxidase [Aeromicrobium sp.]
MDASPFPDLRRMRHEYAEAGLSEDEAGDDPVLLFERWLGQAIDAGVPEPNAMAVATASEDGRPSSRIVLLKGFDAAGMVFFSGYDSRKGRELKANPRAAATMLWHPLQRQVRVEGTVTRVDPAESDIYFASRPRGAQISAAASPQSRTVADRAALEGRRAEVERMFQGREVVRPEGWGGYRIALDVMEFWQGRSGRFHDRIHYVRRGDAWDRSRLAP